MKNMKPGFTYIYINRRVRGYHFPIINVNGTYYMELPKTMSPRAINDIQLKING